MILLIALLLGGCMPENAAGTETTVPIQIGTDDSAEKKESGTIWERVSNASGDPSSEETDKGSQVTPGRSGQEMQDKDEESEKAGKPEETKKPEE
ncbi:MAG: hypothetical protein J6Z35_08240, partial [Lachnospiraceae bacterium]|nr:hypothetical protein [Lachnospiraceae bacterium]